MPRRRFFRKAPARPRVANPRTITAHKNPACPQAVADRKRAGELWRFSRLRQRKHLNSIVEQDRRRGETGGLRGIKRLVRPGLGFGGSESAKRTLAGCGTRAVVGKGRVRDIGGGMQAQAAFVAGLFGVAA